MDERVCTACGQSKPEDQFYISGKKGRHRRRMCGPCRSRQIQRQKEAKGVRPVHRRLGYAIERGQVVRPSVCEDCGASAKVDAHHTDYSKPLDVVWVCRSCHRNRHSEEAGLRTRVDMRLENELLEKVDEVRGSVSRTTYVEKALRAYMSGKARDVAPEEVREPVGELKREGRKLDPYPSAPSDPESRADWTGKRVPGWAPFGKPARVLNAELIAQQQKKDGR